VSPLFPNVLFFSAGSASLSQTAEIHRLAICITFAGKRHALLELGFTFGPVFNSTLGNQACVD
jgi:hypothetical protein